MPRLLSCCAPLVLLLSASPSRAATAMIEGHVIDQATGQPIAGARVSLARDIGDEPLLARTDDRGHFEFSGLAQAIHYIYAERPGYMMPGAWPSSRPGPTSVDLRLPADQGPASVARYSSGLKVDKSVNSDGAVRAQTTLELVRYGVITGKITSPYGTPLPGARMQLFMKGPILPGVEHRAVQQRLPDGQAVFPVACENSSSDDRGEFRCAFLTAGTYYLRAEGWPGNGQWASDYRATYYPGALDFKSARPLELAVGQSIRADVRVKRLAGVRVSGRLSAPPSAPELDDTRTQYRVTLVPPHSRGGDPSPTAEVRNREFTFENVLPGKYYLRATVSERSEDRFDDTDWTPLYGILREVEVGSNDVTGLDLVLQPLPEIEGKVDFASGCAAVPVTLQVMPVGSSYISQRPLKVDSAGGRFTLRGVPLGLVRLWASPHYPPAQPYWVQAVTLDGRDIRNQDFETPLPTGASVKITVVCPASRSAR